MPGVGGLEATRRIKAELPVCRILILTVSEEDADLFAAIKSGAQGYLLKSTSIADLIRYIHATMAGEAAISGVMAAKMLNEFTRPEAQVDRRPGCRRAERARTRGAAVRGGRAEQSRHRGAPVHYREHGEEAPAQHPGEAARPEPRAGCTARTLTGVRNRGARLLQSRGCATPLGYLFIPLPGPFHSRKVGPWKALERSLGGLTPQPVAVTVILSLGAIDCPMCSRLAKSCVPNLTCEGEQHGKSTRESSRKRPTSSSTSSPNITSSSASTRTVARLTRWS